MSWAEFAVTIARTCKLDERLIDAVPVVEMGWLAPRPAYVPLASTRGALLSSLDEAIKAFADEIEKQGKRQSAAA